MDKFIETEHGTIHFPAFFPDATYGTIKSLSWKDVKKSGCEQIVTTTLHLENTITSEVIARRGGVHKFFGWNRPILTDSGGYQVFSLIYRRVGRKNVISNAGCTFTDPLTNKTTFLSPEISQIIQFRLNPDIVTVLDVPILAEATSSQHKLAIKRNTEWAKRSKKKFLMLHNLTEDDFNNTKIKRPLIGAVIQGGYDKNLRKQSAESLIEIGFDLYNFGGPPITRENTWNYEMRKEFDYEMLQFVSSCIPEGKPKYAMGVGTPDDLAFSVKVGWNLFDTVLPTRNGRHGYLYVSYGVGDTSFKHYDVLRIKNSKHELAEIPLDPACSCECCSSTTRSQLRNLFKIKDPQAWRLASIHNLTFYNKFIRKLRLDASFN